MNRSLVLRIVLVMFFIASAAQTARAAIIADGNVEPADPSTWDSDTYGYIGNTASGTVTVDSGSDLYALFSYIGRYSSSTGVVTVAGTGSTWTNSSSLYVGGYGSGTLNITGGGDVSDSYGHIGYHSGSTGMATVAGTGSTWNNSYSLYVGDNGSGALNITDGGDVSNSSGYIGYSSFGSTGVVTVDGAGSTWNNNGGITIGRYGSGILYVSGGGTVTSHSGSIGLFSNSTGTVTIAGTGSMWNNTYGTNPSLKVGRSGSGVLNVLKGAYVSSRLAYIGGDGVGSSGTVTVDGAGSTWNNSNSVNVGEYSSGTLNITGGGTVSDKYGCIGVLSNSAGVVTVDGNGSVWNNTYNSISQTNLCVGLYGSGTLNITGGGTVTATSVSINSQSLLAIDVGNGSSLTVNSGGGKITNDGVVRIIAGAGAAAGAAYTPISTGTWDGGGSYQAIGGKWNTTSHVFTASAVQAGNSGTPVNINLANIQRMLIGDSGTGWSLGASFLATDSSTSLDFMATAISSAIRAALEDQLYTGGSVLGGWQFDGIAGGYTPGDPAYLSFDIGTGYSRDDLDIWHYDGANWTEYAAADLTCNGTYASFTVTGFSGYAVTAVPEPGTLALLLAAALVGLLTLVRRRRK